MAYKNNKYVELPETGSRDEQRFNQAPTGHKLPEGRSKDDPNMEFCVPDIERHAFGQFSYPFRTCLYDLPHCLKEQFEDGEDHEDEPRNQQGF